MSSASTSSAENKRRSVATLSSLLRFSFPLIIANLSLAAMQFADSVFVGMLGTTELAAITTPTLLISILSAFAYSGFAIIATFVSQAYGRGDLDKCQLIAIEGLIISVCVSALYLMLWPFAGWIFSLFGHEIETFEKEVALFRVYLLALPLEVVTLVLSNFFLGIKKPSVPVMAGLLAILLNIPISYCLVFGVAGFPEVGFLGVAWGTIIALVIEMFLVAVLFIKRTRPLGLSLRINGNRIKKLIHLGGASGLQGGIDVLCWGGLLLWMIGLFGDAHLAAGGILLRCMHVTFLPAEAIGTAIVVQVGESIGKHRYRLARSQVRLGFQFTAIYMTGLAVVGYVFREQIIHWFTSDSEVIRLANASFIWICLFQFFDALNIVYINALQGAGDTVWPTWANIILAFVVLGGGGIIVINLTEMMSFGIWMLVAIYIFLQGIVFWSRWRSRFWQEITL